jgi:nucleotide-binding universal stress UspA family protein
MKFKPTNREGGVVVELGPEESQLPAAAARPEFKLKKILVPVDFSDCSRKALQYALLFARQFNARLVLLNVIEPFIPVPEMTAVNFDVIRKETLRSSQEELKALQETIPADVSSETIIREGSPHVEIALATKQLGVDLIIIATHGRTGLAHVFMGSTAERVVRHADCPVLTVREREHEFVATKAAA